MTIYGQEQHVLNKYEQIDYTDNRIFCGYTKNSIKRGIK